MIGQPEAMSGPAGIPLPAPRPGRGSGVVVTSDCLVVTNRHVVEHAAALAVRFWRPDRLYAARVAHLSSTHDLAVLVVDRDVCAPIVSPVAAVTPVRGMTVFKIGFGGDATREAMTNKVPAIQRGVLSRPVDVAGAPTLEVYVPVEAGDSGGLVCAEDGAMVGLTLAHGRARAEIGYVVPGALVAATLYQAQSTGAIARARAELADPAFPAERLAAELGAAIAEGEPAAAVLRQAAAVRELEQSLALRWRGRPAGRLVLAALAASAGALRALEPSPPERAAGCRLLARAREAMAEERWRTPGAAPTVYETQLAAALAHGLPLAAACGPAPRARPAPGAAT
ncbi:MAG TPA: serine protease, partial [Polyangia bacterium]